jgi:hypothetical protein
MKAMASNLTTTLPCSARCLMAPMNWKFSSSFQTLKVVTKKS